jgi:hypothetical protein
MSPETIKLLNMSWKEAHESNGLSEWRDAEKESFWWRYMNSRYEKDTQMKMILSDTGDFCIDDLYFDHALSRGFVSSCYTSDGLREREGWMIRQICSDNRKYSLYDLERMVVQNPHYHDTIKANLIYNINNRRLER